MPSSLNPILPILLCTLLLFVSAHQHDHSHDHNHAHTHNTNSKIPVLLTPLQTFISTLSIEKAALTSSLLVSSISLISLLLLPLISQTAPLLHPFAAGALLSDLFLHLLPHVYSHPTSLTAPCLLLSTTLFLLLDILLRRLTPSPTLSSNRSAAYINLAADALHNFCDGLSLAAAYLASPAAGLATTLAIVLHELPQELADYAVLVRAGFSRRNALVANVVCAGTALLGTAAALRAAEVFESAEGVILPFAAGAMMYMTFVTVLPDVVADVVGEKGGLKVLGRLFVSLCAGAAGVAVVALVESVDDHTH